MESQMWWYTSVILALGRQRQKNQEFKARLGHIVSYRPTVLLETLSPNKQTSM
jgi:hypothetical protein